jgi:hypothetical protein
MDQTEADSTIRTLSLRAIIGADLTLNPPACEIGVWLAPLGMEVADKGLADIRRRFAKNPRQTLQRE